MIFYYTHFTLRRETFYFFLKVVVSKNNTKFHLVYELHRNFKHWKLTLTFQGDYPISIFRATSNEIVSDENKLLSKSIFSIKKKRQTVNSVKAHLLYFIILILPRDEKHFSPKISSEKK